MKLKTVRIVSLAALVVMVFVTLDLGLNVLYNLVPEFLDGYTSHSTLQGQFGIFGDSGWTLGRFYTAFERAAWLTFALLVENAALIVAAWCGRG